MQKEGEKVDLVVVNPPRKGCDEGVLKRICGHLAPLKLFMFPAHLRPWRVTLIFKRNGIYSSGNPAG